MASRPRISLIICTRNRAQALVACLNSVSSAAAHYVGGLEFIIVDNGSTDDTAQVIEAWRPSAGGQLNHLVEPKKGLSRAKNRGLEAATGEIIAFTDDDCRLGETYFTDLASVYEGVQEPVLIGGRVELGDADDLPFTIKPDLDPQTYNPTIHPGGFAHGCNLTFNRPALERLGGFDVRLGPGSRLGAAEDTDLVFRAHVAGLPVRYDPSFVVWHHHGRQDRDEVRSLHHAYNVGNGALYLKHGVRHPKLLKHFYWDVRDGFRERLGGRLFNDELGFTHWGKVKGNIEGALLMLRRSRED